MASEWLGSHWIVQSLSSSGKSIGRDLHHVGHVGRRERILLRGFGIPDWDVVMVGVGDGSGLKWDIGGAWAVATVIRGERSPSVEWGAWSSCAIMLAELKAYEQGLTTLGYRDKTAKVLRSRIGRPLQVVVMTDNSNIVAQSKVALGSAAAVNGRPHVLGPVIDNVTGPTWCALNGLCARGYVLRFVQIPRCSLELSWAMDNICGKVRELIQDRKLMELPKGVVFDGMNCL